MNKNELKDFIEDVLPEGRVLKCVELSFYAATDEIAGVAITQLREHAQLHHAHFCCSLNPSDRTLVVQLSAK